MTNFNLISSIKDNKFLPVNTSNIFNKFVGTDNESSFKKNLAVQPNDWVYRSKPVNYNLNKDFYRTYEFETIDWTNSIVIFGCSCVFGVGLDEEDTLSRQLSKLLNKPVINIGVPASGIFYSLYNSIILSEGYPTPQAVVHLWTDYDRSTYFKKQEIINGGPWNMKLGDYTDAWTQNPYNTKTHAVFASKISKQMWQEKTKYYEASFFRKTAELIECDYIDFNADARDFMHPGIDSIYNAAVKIAENLKL